MCSSFQQLWDNDDGDDCYLLEHPTCCLVLKNCLIIILVEVKPNLNHYSESDNVLSHITEISRGGTSSWFIWGGCWEKSVKFSQFSLSLSPSLSLPPPMIFCDSLSFCYWYFLFLSLPLCFCLCFSLFAFSLSLKLSPFIISLIVSFFLPLSLCLFTSLSFFSLPLPSFHCLYSTLCLFSFPPSLCLSRSVPLSPHLSCLPPTYSPVCWL